MREPEPQETTLEGWTDVGHTTADPLPIVVGRVNPVTQKVTVDEKDLQPGRYRVQAGEDGPIVGEIVVTDPVTHVFRNRAARRKNKERNGQYARRMMQRHRWGRD